MNKLTYILSIIIILSVFGGCKKYNEGPYFSLRSKTNRLCREWVMKNSNINGNEIHDNEIKEEIWEFDKNQILKKTITYENGSNVEEGPWYFDGNKRAIFLFSKNETTYYLQDSLEEFILDSVTGEKIIDTVVTYDRTVYFIKRLKADELKLECKFYNNIRKLDYYDYSFNQK